MSSCCHRTRSSTCGPFPRRRTRIGVPVVVVQKETTISEATMQTHSAEMRDAAPFIADHMTVCSERHRQFWVRAGAPGALGRGHRPAAVRPLRGAACARSRRRRRGCCSSATSSTPTSPVWGTAWVCAPGLRCAMPPRRCWSPRASQGRCEVVVKCHPQQDHRAEVERLRRRAHRCGVEACPWPRSMPTRGSSSWQATSWSDSRRQRCTRPSRPAGRRCTRPGVTSSCACATSSSASTSRRPVRAARHLRRRAGRTLLSPPPTHRSLRLRAGTRRRWDLSMAMLRRDGARLVAASVAGDQRRRQLDATAPRALDCCDSVVRGGLDRAAQWRAPGPRVAAPTRSRSMARSTLGRSAADLDSAPARSPMPRDSQSVECLATAPSHREGRP